MENKLLTIIGGATCSGKSDLAFNLALQEKNKTAVIINADCMQMFKDLPILTAQPTIHNDDKGEKIIYKFYGFLEFFEEINAVSWAKMVSDYIKEVDNGESTIIVVGGTGMYLRVLLKGISELPLISKDIRKEANEINYEDLCRIVYKNDKKLKEIINVSQHRQMLRAYEVFRETGYSIRYFFEKPKIKFLEDSLGYEVYITDVPREVLYENINKRFRWMINNGAIEEVQNLLKKTNDKRDFQIFQAIGAREICDYLDGVYSKEEMIERACMNSRKYAKRQITWFRNQKL